MKLFNSPPAFLQTSNNIQQLCSQNPPVSRLAILSSLQTDRLVFGNQIQPDPTLSQQYTTMLDSLNMNEIGDVYKTDDGRFIISSFKEREYKDPQGLPVITIKKEPFLNKFRIKVEVCGVIHREGNHIRFTPDSTPRHESYRTVLINFNEPHTLEIEGHLTLNYGQAHSVQPRTMTQYETGLPSGERTTLDPPQFAGERTTLVPPQFAGERTALVPAAPAPTLSAVQPTASKPPVTRDIYLAPVQGRNALQAFEARSQDLNKLLWQLYRGQLDTVNIVYEGQIIATLQRDEQNQLTIHKAESKLPDGVSAYMSLGDKEHNLPEKSYSLKHGLKINVVHKKPVTTGSIDQEEFSIEVLLPWPYALQRRFKTLFSAES